MTLIIGVRGTDGLVLAADRKILRGGETHFADKIVEVGGVVLAFEGLTGLQADFQLVLRGHLSSQQKGFSTLYEAKLLIEDIVLEFSQRYVDRLGEDAYFGALLAGLSNISEGPAELYYIHPQGYGEAVPYRCSGHGADYAHTLAKYLLTSDQPITTLAYRAAFLIAWVSEEIDNTVGGVPQAAMVRDGQQDFGYLDESLTRSAIEHASKIKTGLLDAFQIADVPKT